MKIRKSLILLMIILLLPITSPNFSVKAQTNVEPTGFWLNSRDVICLEVTEASINGSDGIPLWDFSPSPVLNANDTVSFMPENIPDWATDPFESMNYTVYVDGFLDEFHITSAPWEMNYLEVDGPPAFMPLLPIGNTTYWNNLKTELEGQGFQVSINTTNNIFHYEYSGENVTVSADYLISTGALNYYKSIVKSYENEELLIMNMEFRLYVLFAPSHLNLEWTFERPVLDYIITAASEINGSDGLKIVPSNDGKHNPIWGEGTIYPNQLLSVDIESLPDLSTKSPNYIANFMTNTGKFAFNITLDVPRFYPQENNSGFLYPLMPVMNKELIGVIIGVAQSLGSNYSASVTSDQLNLVFDDGKRRIEVNWSIPEGVMTYYSYKEEASDDFPGMIISFTLAVSGDLNDFDFHWGENTGVKHYYEIVDAISGDNDSIEVYGENNNLAGYLFKGDTLELTATTFSSFGDEGLYEEYEMKNLDEGWTTNIKFYVERPGHFNFEGPPPYLYFHYLVGNDAGFNWFKQVMAVAGATMTEDVTNNEIQISWTYYVNNELGFIIKARWNKTSGVLNYYYLEYFGNIMEGANGMYLKLVISIINNYSTQNDSTETTNTSPMFLDSPQFFLISLPLVMIVLLNKKVKKLN